MLSCPLHCNPPSLCEDAHLCDCLSLSRLGRLCVCVCVAALDACGLAWHVTGTGAGSLARVPLSALTSRQHKQLLRLCPNLAQPQPVPFWNVPGWNLAWNDTSVFQPCPLNYTIVPPRRPYASVLHTRLCFTGCDYTHKHTHAHCSIQKHVIHL